jgi:hypothetical protein
MTAMALPAAAHDDVARRRRAAGQYFATNIERRCLVEAASGTCAPSTAPSTEPNATLTHVEGRDAVRGIGRVAPVSDQASAGVSPGGEILRSHLFDE